LFQARGYYIQIGCSVAFTILLYRIISRKDNGILLYEHFSIVFYSLIGIFSIPTFIYFVTAFYFLLLFAVLRKSQRPSADFIKLALASLTFLISSILIYIPLILVSGIGSITSNKFVIQITFFEFMEKYPSHIFETYNFLLGPFISILIPVILLYFYLKGKRLLDFKILIFSALSALPICLIAFQSVIPFSRTWVFLCAPIWIIIVIFLVIFKEYKSQIELRISLIILILLLGSSSFMEFSNFYSLNRYRKNTCSDLLKLKSYKNLIIPSDLWYHYAQYYNRINENKREYNKKHKQTISDERKEYLIQYRLTNNETLKDKAKIYRGKNKVKRNNIDDN
jgi:hypothetical protein